jgi:hypothetical protein
MGFRMIFDKKNFWATFRLKGRMYHFLLITYHSLVNKNKIRQQIIFWIFIAIFRKMIFLAAYTKIKNQSFKNQRS